MDLLLWSSLSEIVCGCSIKRPLQHNESTRNNRLGHRNIVLMSLDSNAIVMIWYSNWYTSPEGLKSRWVERKLRISCKWTFYLVFKRYMKWFGQLSVERDWWCDVGLGGPMKESVQAIDCFSYFVYDTAIYWTVFQTIWVLMMTVLGFF